jgi:hypothetical protein
MMTTFGLHPKLRLTPELIAALERLLCREAFLATVPDRQRGAVLHFDLGSSLAVRAVDWRLELSVEDVRGWTPDGRPVAIEADVPARCLLPGPGPYTLLVRLDPPPREEDEAQASRYALEAVPARSADTAPAPSEGVLDLGTVRVRAAGPAGFERWPSVSSFGSIGPWDDSWTKWVGTLADRIAGLVREVDRLVGERSRAFTAAVTELGREWWSVPVHTLADRVQWLGRLRTESPEALVFPTATAQVLPKDPGLWPAALARMIDAAVPVPKAPVLIADPPVRLDLVREPAAVRFHFEGLRLHIDFLSDPGPCVGLELRVPNSVTPAASLTFEYGRGAAQGVTKGEARTGEMTGYQLPSPPPGNPLLQVWTVPECEPELLVVTK